MPTFQESSVDQAGDIGGNGIARWHWAVSGGAPVTPELVDSFHALLHTFYTVMAQHTAPTITFAIQAAVRIRDEGSGDLVGMTEANGSSPVIKGLGISGPYPAGVGGRVNWMTGTVVGRRMLRGATFLIPADSGSYTSNGSLSATYQVNLLDSALALIDGSQSDGVPLNVYHRPLKGTNSGGILGQVSGATVGTTPASLRSRRVLQ